MTIVQATYNLRENLPNEFLAYLLLVLNAALNNLLQIATRTVLHYNVNDLVFLIDESIVVLHNISVTEFAQNVNFRNNLGLFLLRHLPIVKFFPHQNLSISFASNLADSTETTYSNKLVFF